MQKIKIHTVSKKILADIFTPVGIYLRLRDKFRDTILLESTDHHSFENSFSFICINAIAGVEISSPQSVEFKLPNQKAEKKAIVNAKNVPELLWDFMQNFEVADLGKAEKLAQGLYGYATYDAVQFFDSVKVQTDTFASNYIPLMRYRLYQYVIAINHFKDEMFLLENKIDGLPSEAALIESLIKSKDIPLYPFSLKGSETSNLTNEQYVSMVQQGIKSCLRGDVFQIVLSRRFEQQFMGDEFNVYRALRNVNPSPYLFYFDYGDYQLMGSSPESQLIIKEGNAIVHPIAGTYRRTGNDEIDRAETFKLQQDPKENAEHVMLVDLARNDLSRVCHDVKVNKYKEVHYYSHVIHLVSEVSGIVPEKTNPFLLLSKTFPAGTLSGAPKIKAMSLIDVYENTHRGYYGGCIGFVGFDGSFNQAIMIRTFLSKNNTLFYQAGAGVVAASIPENELQEVNNKLGALKKAIQIAEEIR
ncbi:MAG: anthranilate synthase component I family protein [Ferruginibacter sp.]|nr:anthranilate synthase component I family protein [Ferruginibacter sp.]